MAFTDAAEKKNYSFLIIYLLLQIENQDVGSILLSPILMP